MSAKLRELSILKYIYTMPQEYSTSTSYTFDTGELEDALASTCAANLSISYRLELRRLATSLWYYSERKKRETRNQYDIEPLTALTTFRANLQRRKKAPDSLTSSRVMDLPDPARTILLTDIAYTFRDEIDNYTQIDFGNAKHVKLLKAAVDSSISKVTNKQGRPVNEALDEFFVGL